MIKEYKFNKEDTHKYLYKVLFQLIIYFTILLIGLIVYKEIEDSTLIINIIVGVLIVWGILYLLPLFILYFNHRSNSISVVFSYDEENDSFKYHSNDRNMAFTLNDIEKVELYLTPNAYEGFIDLQYFGKYHYYVFYLQNSESISLSCLVCDKIEHILPEGYVEKKKKYLPIIE